MYPLLLEYTDLEFVQDSLPLAKTAENPEQALTDYPLRYSEQIHRWYGSS
jgi:hypothetical protein